MAPSTFSAFVVGELLAVHEVHVHAAPCGARPHAASASMTER